MWDRVFRVYGCSHSGDVHRIVSEVLSLYRVSMYTAIAQMPNINIEHLRCYLDSASTEKRSYQYHKFSTESLPIL